MVEQGAFIEIGAGNLVSKTRLLAIVSPDSAPVRRLIQEARERGALIDATAGHKTRSVLIMDSDHVILSGLEISALEGVMHAATSRSMEDAVKEN